MHTGDRSFGLRLSRCRRAAIRLVTTIEADEAVASSDFLKKKKNKRKKIERGEKD